MSNQGVSQLRVSFSLGESRPKVQHWIDASSKDDPHGRMPGRKELRTTGGQGSAFDDRSSPFRMATPSIRLPDEAAR